MENRNKILIVEDDKSILLLLETIFKKEYQVFLAENGKEALDKLQEFKPDVILSDIMMPVMNGLQFKEEINKDTEKAQIPFIFLTAEGNPTTKKKSLELGVEMYIVKPVKPKDIKEIVLSVLK